MHGLLVDAFIPSASALFGVDRMLELFEAVVGPAYFQRMRLSGLAAQALPPEEHGPATVRAGSTRQRRGTRRHLLPRNEELRRAGEALGRRKVQSTSKLTSITRRETPSALRQDPRALASSRGLVDASSTRRPPRTTP